MANRATVLVAETRACAVLPDEPALRKLSEAYTRFDAGRSDQRCPFRPVRAASCGMDVEGGKMREFVDQGFPYCPGIAPQQPGTHLNAALGREAPGQRAGETRVDSHLDGRGLATPVPDAGQRLQVPHWYPLAKIQVQGAGSPAGCGTTMEAGRPRARWRCEDALHWNGDGEANACSRASDTSVKASGARNCTI